MGLKERNVLVSSIKFMSVPKIFMPILCLWPLHEKSFIASTSVSGILQDCSCKGCKQTFNFMIFNMIHDYKKLNTA